MCESKPHSTQKRMLSNVYSKSYIMKSPQMERITKVLLLERFLPILHSYAKTSTAFDVFALLSAVTMDFVTSYQFGLSSNADLLRDRKRWKGFLSLYHSRRSYDFWPQELPFLTTCLKKIGVRLVPKWVDEANHKIEEWTLSMCDGAEDYISHNKINNEDATEDLGDCPVVYSQFQSAFYTHQTKLSPDSSHSASTSEAYRLTIASEMLDHLAAGFDTSGVTLCYFIHEISQHPDLQRSLRSELLTLESPLTFPPTSPGVSIPTSKALETLPLLHAILLETLRLRSPIPGPQPRITPSSGCTLGPNNEYIIPGGVRVSAQAHSLHRNTEVFEDPEEWRPQRWLRDAEDERLKEMNRWFWAFGSGGRMCVGSNLAMYREFVASYFEIMLMRCRDEVYYCGNLFELGDGHC
jgi:Cytochrome P450